MISGIFRFDEFFIFLLIGFWIHLGSWKDFWKNVTEFYLCFDLLAAFLDKSTTDPLIL